MRKVFLLMSLLIIGTAFASVTMVNPVSSDVGVGVTSSSGVPDKIISERGDSLCNSSPAFIDAIKSSMITEYSLADYEFSNLTSEYCYNYSGYKSISLGFTFKKTASDYNSKSVTASFYISDSIDFSVLFTEKENSAIDYTLKYKYLDLLVNGTNDEYFVSLSPAYGSSCDDLRSYYDGLSGEKYFNEESGYCSIILKTRTSEIKGLVNDVVSYVSYFSDKVRFYFSGYAEGAYDLAGLSKSINCSLSSQDYYYPYDSSLDCYGIYKDRTRVYFGASENLGTDDVYRGVSVSVYGYLNGKAKITVSAYGTDVSESDVASFASDILARYFGQSYSVSLTNTGYGLEGSLIIDSLSLNMDALSGLNVSKSMMDTNYYGSNVYATISEPYIQLFSPETPEQAQADLLRPIHWGRSIVITSSKVFSSVTLDVNDNGLAVANVREFTMPYVATSDWLLNMSVTGSYYYPIIYTKADGVAVPETAGSASSSSNALQSTGVRDVFSSSNNVDFSVLDSNPSILDSIVNFFKGLFGLQ